MTNYFRKYRSLYSTTLSTSISTGTGETITFANVTNVPTDTEITITIDRVDSSGSATPTKLERITGTLSGSNLTSYTRGVDNTTEQAHSAGAVVEMVWNAADWNAAIDGFLVEHGQTGAHDNGFLVANYFSASSINSSAINASAVIAGLLGASAVLAGNIAASAVRSGNINASAVVAGNLAASAVVSGNLAASAIVAGNLSASSVVAGNLAASSVVAGNLGFSITPAFVGARAKRTTTQSINQNSVTKVQLNAEDYDTASAFDSATNYRYTVPTGGDGKYLLQGEISWDSNINSGKRATVQIQVGGTAVASQQIIPGAANFITVNCSTIVALAATNYVELYAYQDGTGAINLTAAHLTVSLLGT